MSSNQAARVVDPIFFVGGNNGCSPDVLADVAANDFFQIWNDTVANAVADRREIFVGRIFAKFQPMFAHVIVDLFRHTERNGRTIVRSTSSIRRVEISRIAARPAIPAPRNSLIRKVSTKSSA